MITLASSFSWSISAALLELFTERLAMLSTSSFAGGLAMLPTGSLVGMLVSPTACCFEKDAIVWMLLR